MKSPNDQLTSATRASRTNVRSVRTLQIAATLLAICPFIFSACESANQSIPSSRSSNNPYAQYEPKTPEEEAYYHDVYSGEWREQTDPTGMGKSICKKSGTTTMPPHWAAMPPGAKTVEEIRRESRKPEPYVAANPYPLPPPQAPVPAVAPTQNTYASQAVEVAPQASAPQYAVPTQVAPTQNVYPTQNVPVQSAPVQVVPTQAAYPQQAVPATQQAYPTPNAYPTATPYQGASVERSAYDELGEKAWIVRGQAPDDEDPFADDSDDDADDEAEADPFAEDADDAAEEDDEVEDAAVEEDAKAAPAEPAAKVEAPKEAPKAASTPAVEMKKENVNVKAVAPNAAVAATPVSASSRPGAVEVQPVQIDPSIAAPYANVHQAQPNPSAPSNADAPRVSQDEYVVTGGDSKGKVVAHEDWSVENLDPEDTATHFDTVDGRILTEPTNRVFLYSPRFGAVRQIIAPIEGDQRTAIEVSSVTDAATQEEQAQGVDVRTQEVKPVGVKGRQELAGAESSSAPMIADGRVGVMEADAQLRLGALLTAAGVDDLSSQDSSLMMDGAVAAQGWSSEQGVAVSTDMVNAFSNAYIDGPAMVYAIKDGTVTSKLRVIKIANKDAARPGEFVEFTLRFENIGQEPIGNVTILDNLSARLRYVDGTAKSSVQADFLADLSESGSLVLRWEIAKPLQPKEFGVVRFICKVQ